jgi:sugar (pentulose or hexulose) kinase
MHSVVIGIDLSTTTCKAIAWTNEGALVAQARAPLSLQQPVPGAYEQDPQAWWAAAQQALRGLTAQLGARAVAAVAVVNQRETLAVTDEHDQLLRPALLWLDERRQHEVAQVAEQVGRQRLQVLTGKPYDWSPAIYSLAWMARAEPERFCRVAHVYDPHAWLVRQLTGEFATSWASADPFGAFDIRGHCWADEVLAALPGKVASSAFATAVAPGTVLGRVHRQASQATGLAQGTPVVAGGGDGQAGGLGVGMVRPGTAYLNLGTAVVSGVYSQGPVTSLAFRTMCAVDHDGYVLETSLRAGTLLVNTLVRQFFGLDPATCLPALEADAQAVPAGSRGLLLLPYWNGVMNPYWDAQARGCLLGLGPEHGRGELYRAVLEGIALEQAVATRAVEQATGEAVERFVAIGGGAASPLWCQIIANVCDRPVVRATTQEASSLGAGIAAAVGTGWFDSFAQAAAAMTQAGETLLPQPEEKAFHAELLGVYSELYPSVKGLYGRLAGLRR